MSTTKTDKAVRRRSRAIRFAVLLDVLAVSTGIGLVHQRIEGVAPAGVDALCPFGGLEAAFGLLTAGTFLPKLAASALVLLAATVLVALLFRRSFCGQICPLGTIQELFGRLGRKLFKRRRTLPAALDRPARYLKYVVLAVFTVWTWAAAELVMRPFDPWATYHHLTSAELFATFPIGLAVLGVTVAGSLVYDRFFCKYLCPMGAFLGIISKLGAFRVHREADVCIDCGACDKACPMNVNVSHADDVKSAECIQCAECVNACPVQGALEVRGPGRRTLAPAMLTASVLGVMLLVVGVTTFTGTFAWTTKSIVAETTKTGTFDAGNINGRTSLKEVSEASGVPLADLLAKFKVPEAEAAKPMKEIKDTYGFSPEDVRAYVEEQAASRE
jgi:NAD-dependent dihydropyrimidine dehydrogenase PreA subunit